MNKFDEYYDIRLATYEDIPSIMEFIHQHWSENHILSKDRNLFEYEYLDGEDVKFLLAIRKEDYSIQGIFGYLNCSYSQNEGKKDIWGSIWKVLDDNMPLLGIELAKRIKEATNCRYQIGNGANPNTTIPLRKIFFKEKVAKMKQHYMLNPLKQDFQIAIITNRKLSNCIRKTNNIQLKEMRDIKEIKKQFDLSWNSPYIPFKDYIYIDKRYFQHPYYDYLVYGIEYQNNVQALLILRKIKILNSNILRIVDYIGNQEVFQYVGEYLQKLLIENNSEYIDFYEYGFEEQYIKKAGLLQREEEDSNIFPNYFEPFLQKNIDIWVHFKEENTTFFKADGDQDRPNIYRMGNIQC